MAMYWSFHNLSDIYLFKMKVMFYICGTPGDGRTLPHNILEEMRFRYYRSVPSGERCRGDCEAAGCTLGQCITLAYKMAARWAERFWRNARRQAGRPNWIVIDTAKRF